MLTRCSPLLRLAIGHARPSATLNLPKKTPRPWWDGNTRHSVHSSSIRREEDPPRKKRPSPYRLLQPHTFLAAFAPLHVAGWRLDVLPSVSTSTGPRREEGLRLEEGMNDLQGRRLIRAYQFPEGREGWRELVDFMQSIGRVVEEEDHHPSILIAPSADYIDSSNNVASSGYVLEISTHTHTPMPPLRSPIPSSGAEASPIGKMKPGVTGKDTKLAERLEEAYRDRTGGVPA